MTTPMFETVVGAGEALLMADPLVWIAGLPDCRPREGPRFIVPDALQPGEHRALVDAGDRQGPRRSGPASTATGTEATLGGPGTHINRRRLRLRRPRPRRAQPGPARRLAESAE